ncbi:MAG: hypothetical protein H6Q62_401 [Firmicutes bacterium]|nr:hypothetical protein [Bacillota bacterium]
MKFASEDLRHEHEGILYGLEILEDMADRLNDALLVEVEDLESMIHFLKLFADKCHHGKEEGLLFPSLEKAGIPREGGPIGVMLAEHVEGRALIARMSAALEGNFVPQKFAEAAIQYVQLLRAHIDKENQVLFVMADQRLPQVEQEQLLETFESFEAEVMGPGVHEKLHHQLEHLAKKYHS